MPYHPIMVELGVAVEDQSCCWLPAGERRIVLSLAVSSVLLFAVFIKVSETDPSFSEATTIGSTSTRVL
jgi:hypothetical protein